MLKAEEMDQADEELRDTVRSIWPLQAKKILDLLIPRNEGNVFLLDKRITVSSSSEFVFCLFSVKLHSKI